MMKWPRALLAIVMLSVTYVFAFGVVLLNLGVAVAPIVVIATHPGFALLSIFSGALAMITAANIIVITNGMVVAARRIGDPWSSVRVPAQDAQALTAMIADIAAQARAPVPAELRLTAVPNAAVSEGTRIFGIGGGPRRLYLGLPILAGMSTAELRAVLAHEIGHYAGGHSRFGVLVHRGSVSLISICLVLRMLRTASPRKTARGLRRAARFPRVLMILYVTLDYWIFTGYAALYDRLCFFIRRSQEYEADRIAARIAGGAELAAALRRMYVLAAAWNDFRDRFLGPMQRAGCMPDNPFEAFGRMLEDEDYQAVLRRWESAPPGPQATPFATHPCLADRITRLASQDAGQHDRGPAEQAGGPGKQAGGPGKQAGGPGKQARRPGAASLLPALPDRPWVPELCENMVRSAKFESLPWNECVNRVGQARAAAAAGVLLDAVRLAASPAGAPTLAKVLDQVTISRGELAARVAASGAGMAASGAARDADPLNALTVGLVALVGASMVATGRARWQFTWSDASGLPRLAGNDIEDTETEQIGDRVSRFVAQPTAANADSVTLHLIWLGIDPQAPMDLTSGPIAAAKDPPSAGGPKAPPATAAAAGKLVIRPAKDPREADARAWQWMIGGPLALAAVIAAIVATHSQNTQVPVPYVPTPTYVAAVPARTFSGVSLPTQVPVPIPTMNPVITGFAGECPPPLSTAAVCTVIMVRRGDSLSLLACRYRTSVRTLQRINSLGTSTALDAGKDLVVPLPPEGTAKCG
jgi:Zn-dependent protease with chaperone function